MDEDYFSGIKLGVDQALTGKTHYQDYQKELFGPSGILIPAKEYEGASTDDGMNVLDLGTTQSPPADKEDAEMEAKIESFYKNKTEPFPSFVYFFFFAVILLMLIEFFDSLIF